jgi:hypothetical protein
MLDSQVGSKSRRTDITTAVCFPLLNLVHLRPGEGLSSGRVLHPLEDQEWR